MRQGYCYTCLAIGGGISVGSLSLLLHGPFCCPKPPHQSNIQGALKGTNLRGQTEAKRRFSLIFADSRLFLENEAFGKRRFSQKTADFRRKPQKTAGTRRKPQIGVCPLRFVPLSAALNMWKKRARNSNNTAKFHGNICQEKFDHDKGQKSAISGRRLHWRLSTGFFFASSPVFMCNLVRRAPQNLEKVAKNPVEKIAPNPVTSVAVMVFSALNLFKK